jgi:ubiquinone/menaquinone biosynthesis C-methylase UbiE
LSLLCAAFFAGAGCATGQYQHQPPEQVMDSIGVRAGMVVAEVGAGSGRYVVPMARRVGDEGKVYANDINKGRLEDLEERCEKESIQNVTIILGEVKDPLLPPNTMDLIYMINTYHHLDMPVELMANIAPALKPGGTLVIIEHDPLKAPSMESHSTAREIVIDQAEEAGYTLERVMTFLSRDNIYIFSYPD